MKIFLKKLLINNNLLILAILVFSSCVRFYNFPNRVTFWSEQSRSLMVSAGYFEKLSLLGQEYFIRFDSNGHVLYSSPIFNYLLTPLLLITKDPIAITVFFAVLNVFIGYLVFLIAKRIFNFQVGIISAILFLFNDYMIYHSLFIWIYNFLPLIGILSIYCIYQFLKKQKNLYIFMLGILSGIGVGLQVLYGPLALAVLAFIFWRSNNKFLCLIYFIFGFICANIPTVIFDVRHDFYHTRTLFQFFLDTFQGKSNASFAYYYLLPFWPVATIIGGLIISKIYKWKKILGILIILTYVYLNLTSQKVSFTGPNGMPNDLNVADIDNASKLVAQYPSDNFNVSEVLDFDKRAYVLRYFIQYKYGKKPKGVEEYTNLRTLYVLSSKEYDYNHSNIWEIKANWPYNITLMDDIGTGYSLYKLSK